MRRYWVKHRLIYTLIFGVILALLMVLLFVFPYIVKEAQLYNSKSLYANTSIDFIVPEPSFDQVDNLPGTYGVDKVFPFFMTKTQVLVNGTKHLTTVMLSDQPQNVDITMYNPSRLIARSEVQYDNSVLVDWQFCHNTSTGLGDTITIIIGGEEIEFRICAIYETNSIYDGDTILAWISQEMAESIRNKSANNGYSAMYVSASDYNTCRSFLLTDYRPLGRLRSQENFASEEQYLVHYNAIMSAGYGNEITDFRIKESSLISENNPAIVWIGALLSIVMVFMFNFIMRKRGCERGYFTRYCLPNGLNVKPYYCISSISETVLFILVYILALICRIAASDEYIPKLVIDVKMAIIPFFVIGAEIACLLYNTSAVANSK